MMVEASDVEESEDERPYGKGAKSRDAGGGKSPLAAQSLQPPTDSLRHGILLKKGRSKMGVRPWVLRTVYIERSCERLLYYDGDKLRGEVPLEGTTISLTPELSEGRGFAFEVRNIPSARSAQMNSLLLVAGSEREAHEWVAALTSAAATATRNKMRCVTGYTTLEEASADNAAAKDMDWRQIKEQRHREHEEKRKQQQGDDRDSITMDDSSYSISALLPPPATSMELQTTRIIAVSSSAATISAGAGAGDTSISHSDSSSSSSSQTQQQPPLPPSMPPPPVPAELADDSR